MDRILKNTILETKKYKTQIEEIILPEYKIKKIEEFYENENTNNLLEYNVEHYTILNNNLIQCNYCSIKPYDISKTKKYINKHLIYKHNIIINTDI
jgi:hypothetical protein